MDLINKIVIGGLVLIVAIMVFSYFTVQYFIQGEIKESVFEYCDQNKNCGDACYWWHYGQMKKLESENDYDNLPKTN